jgi:hypothetical protein
MVTENRKWKMEIEKENPRLDASSNGHRALAAAVRSS